MLGPIMRLNNISSRGQGGGEVVMFLVTSCKGRVILPLRFTMNHFKISFEITGTIFIHERNFFSRFHRLLLLL